MSNYIYRKMIEDSPIAYLHIEVVKDENNKYIGMKIKDTNKAYERFFGDASEEKSNYYINNKMSKKEMEEWEYIFNKSKKNEKYIKEIYVKRINSYFNVEVYSTDSNEYHIRFTKISKQHMNLSSTLKNSPFIAWIKNRNGVYVDVNEKFLEFFEKTYDEVIGHTDYELFSRDSADEFTAKDNMIIKYNKLEIFEEFIDSNNNKSMYLQTAKWPYTEENNSLLLGTIGISIEITNKIELLKNIEKNEKTFLEIANNIEEVIVIADEKKAYYISPSFERVFGGNPEKLYEDINTWKENWKSFEPQGNVNYEYNSKEPVLITFKGIRKNQEEKWFWIRIVSLLDAHGNVTKKICVISDITQTKKGELELEKLRMDFLANISHELRTPINLILSSLQVLNLKMNLLDEDLFNYFGRYLNIVNQNGKRLLKLVNNLIDTTRLDSGCFSYNPKNKDIVSYVENICLSLSEFVKSNNLSIIFDTDVEEKLISFDPDNMERIVLNLISNAIKFNKPGGKIEVSISCKEDIEISVKDSGIGIPEDKIDKIFERFEQVKNNSKREGSGIGLNLVKSLVEMNNGSIKVKSDLGKGSKFTIVLPNTLLKNSTNHSYENSDYINNENQISVEFSDICI
ncbi:two-component sensor histidine kinase [Paraclostridium bifermentans]|uniref:sensor histidine kinase n=1 Tax=Paraclostridium bifermentans TaxID=1490 RepID=UPI0021C3A641|nr:ATP-binding protein [Paraclostridium bifermentans]GKZ02309.1 two-component sensor histidine kinase [Paraclostridium bifermentans]GKZ05466.1 two-component sensor histidine kinase [Paraclostridium bifermentans]GKZ09499.1 two-component sensor histidine kinase [Paraclostridium bifermentans]